MLDFEPYKPVLGYYVNSHCYELTKDTWTGYLAIRLGMTYLAVGTLFVGASSYVATFVPPLYVWPMRCWS